jgi:hypothetical protein
LIGDELAVRVSLLLVDTELSFVGWRSARQWIDERWQKTPIGVDRAFPSVSERQKKGAKTQSK